MWIGVFGWRCGFALMEKRELETSHLSGIVAGWPWFKAFKPRQLLTGREWLISCHCSLVHSTSVLHRTPFLRQRGLELCHRSRTGDDSPEWGPDCEIQQVVLLQYTGRRPEELNTTGGRGGKHCLGRF